MDKNIQERTWSTGDVARLLQISKSTLIRWIRVGFLQEPAVVQVGRVHFRIWRRDDVVRAWNHKKNYFWWTRGQIERGKNDGGTQPGPERPGGEQPAGTQPTEDNRA
jgi:hypothetical protein